MNLKIELQLVCWRVKGRNSVKVARPRGGGAQMAPRPTGTHGGEAVGRNGEKVSGAQ